MSRHILNWTGDRRALRTKSLSMWNCDVIATYENKNAKHAVSVVAESIQEASILAPIALLQHLADGDWLDSQSKVLEAEVVSVTKAYNLYTWSESNER